MIYDDQSVKVFLKKFYSFHMNENRIEHGFCSFNLQENLSRTGLHLISMTKRK